jgi:hypothetical protein
MFIADGRTESFLTSIGVKWTYQNGFKFKELLANWETTNLGRSRAKVEEAVLEYAELSDAGSNPPAPIIFLRPNGYDVLDGVQRLLSEVMRNATEFSAYKVETDSDVLPRLIRVMANHRLQGGHQEDSQWTIKQAVALLVLDKGMSIKEVASFGGWTPAQVEQEVKFQQWSFAIRAIGGPHEMTKGVVLVIAKHGKMEDLQKALKPVAAFCEDLKRGRFSNGDAEPFVREFFNVDRKKGKLHDQFTQKLEDFRDHDEVRTRLEGRRATKLRPEINLRRAVRTLVTVTEEMMRAKVKIAYPDEFYQGLNQARANIQRLSAKVALPR